MSTTDECVHWWLNAEMSRRIAKHAASVMTTVYGTDFTYLQVVLPAAGEEPAVTLKFDLCLHCGLVRRVL